MSESQEPVLIICALREEGETSGIPGSAEETCGECGADVWLAPSGQVLRVQHDATLVCTTCGLVHMQKPDARMGELTQEQIDEVRDALRRAFL